MGELSTNTSPAMRNKHPMTGTDMPDELLWSIEVPDHIDLLDPARLKETAQRSNVVIVHCTIPAGEDAGTFYIRRPTFLLDHRSRLQHQLLHTEGIGHEEMDDVVKSEGRPLHFTLYFAGLSRDCSEFDLVERSADAFPFVVRNIQRNSMDVYHVTLSERTHSTEP